MSIFLKNLTIHPSRAALAHLPEGKLLINTINAHSYNTARKDLMLAEALTKGDVLIPDGASIVWACRWLNAKSQPPERCAGWDLFIFEMQQLEARSAKEMSSAVEVRRKMKVMFMGSSERVLSRIVERAAQDFPHLDVITYSPPFKAEFNDDDNQAMISAINATQPDLLWIGMTAPKQEKWTYTHWDELRINCHVGTIGAVFDFYAGTARRAPLWWQRHGLEWLYRLAVEPRRMWKRYVIGNPLFICNIIKERFFS